MTAYFLTAAAVTVFAFLVITIEWSSGLTRREKIKEIALTLGAAIAFGLIWPLGLLLLAMLRIWDLS